MSKNLIKKDMPQTQTQPQPQQDQPHLHRLNPFGKHQRIISLIAMLFFYQLPLILSITLLIYSFVYMQYQIWAAFILITIVQYPIAKCQFYINFVNNYINPLLYFKSFKRIFQQPIPLNQEKCLFAFHPHSVFAYGLLANMNYHNSDALSRMIGLSSRFMLNMPVTGLLLRLWGVQAVDPTNLKKLMLKGQNIGLLPGGFQQATLTTPNQLRIYIQNRKGFIKYALKYNYTIYPTVVLNQHQAFWTFDHFLRLRMLMNRIKLPGVLFFSLRSGFFYPTSVEFVTVVGKGLKGREYKESEEPMVEEIEEMHKRYINEVKRVYDKHKEKNGGKPLVMF